MAAHQARRIREANKISIYSWIDELTKKFNNAMTNLHKFANDCTELMHNIGEEDIPLDTALKFSLVLDCRNPGKETLKFYCRGKPQVKEVETNVEPLLEHGLVEDAVKNIADMLQYSVPQGLLAKDLWFTAAESDIGKQKYPYLVFDFLISLQQPLLARRAINFHRKEGTQVVRAGHDYIKAPPYSAEDIKKIRESYRM